MKHIREIVGAFFGCECVEQSCDAVPKAVDGALGGLSQQRLELGEELLNRIEVRRMEALQAIKRLPELDRRRVRAAFERRFTARRMAEDYLRLYQALSDIRDRRQAKSRAERPGGDWLGARNGDGTLSSGPELGDSGQP
jgi:hypothetical protein